jgi:hypothetical protein
MLHATACQYGRGDDFRVQLTPAYAPNWQRPLSMKTLHPFTENYISFYLEYTCGMPALAIPSGTHFAQLRSGVAKRDIA